MHSFQVTKRIYQIDLFRFLAAVAVVIFHYTFRGYHADQLSVIDYPTLSGSTRYLYLGVDLFFIISGFVILMSMKDSTLPKFINSRLSRIYPAFWIAVTLTSIVIILFKDPKFVITAKQYLTNMTLLNSALGFENIDGVYWSLIIELKFYFLMGILLFFKGLNKIKFVIVGWLTLAFIMYFVGYGTIINKILKTVFFPQYCSYFVAGMVFYLIYHEKSTKFYIITLLISYTISILTSLERASDFGREFGTIFRADVIIVVITLFYLFMYLVSIGKLNRLNRKSFVVLGAMTYPLYLLHQNIGFIIINKINYQINKYILLFGLTIGMLILSFLFQKYLERPFARLMKRSIERLIISKTKKTQMALTYEPVK